MPKAKKYYWLKLKNDFFNNREIKKLRKIAGGDTYVIIYLKMQLHSIKNNGIISFEGTEESLAEQLAIEFDEETNNVKVTLAFLERNKLIEKVEEDSYFLNKVSELIGKETTAAERMRIARAQKANNVQECSQKANNVQECSQKFKDVPKCYTEIEKEIELELEKEKEKQKGLKHDLYNIPKTEIKKENTGCLKNISSSSDLFDVNLFEEKSPERFIEKEVIEKKLTKHIPVIQKLEYTVPLQDQYIHKKLLNSFDNQTCLKAIKITNDRKIAAGPGKIAYALEVARNVEFEDVLLMQPQEYLNYLSDRFKNIDLNALIEFCQSSEQSDTHILKGSSQSVADQSKVKFARICKDFSFKYENGMDVISDRFFKNVKSEV